MSEYQDHNSSNQAIQLTIAIPTVLLFILIIYVNFIIDLFD